MRTFPLTEQTACLRMAAQTRCSRNRNAVPALRSILELFGAQDRHDVESGNAAGGGPDIRRGHQWAEKNGQCGGRGNDGLPTTKQPFVKASPDNAPRASLHVP